MTVRQLIEELGRHPPDARVFEEREGELRELLISDISFHPTGIGHPVESVDDTFVCANSWADEEQQEVVGPIVVLSSWA